MEKKHQDADYLSRNAVEEFAELKENADKVVDMDDINVLLTSAFRRDRVVDHVNIEVITVHPGDKLEKINKEELIKEQKQDKIIAPVYKMMETEMMLDAKDKKLGRDSTGQE